MVAQSHLHTSTYVPFQERACAAFGSSHPFCLSFEQATGIAWFAVPFTFAAMIIAHLITPHCKHRWAQDHHQTLPWPVAKVSFVDGFQFAATQLQQRSRFCSPAWFQHFLAFAVGSALHFDVVRASHHVSTSLHYPSQFQHSVFCFWPHVSVRLRPRVLVFSQTTYTGQNVC